LVYSCPYVLDLQTDFGERKECVGRHHRHGDAPPPQLAPQLARQREDEDPDDARDGDVVAQRDGGTQESLARGDDRGEDVEVCQQVREHLRVDGRGASVFIDVGGQVERYCEGMVCRRVVVLCLCQFSCIRSTRSIGFPFTGWQGLRYSRWEDARTTASGPGTRSSLAPRVNGASEQRQAYVRT
jgi:hypothetical protein